MPCGPFAPNAVTDVTGFGLLGHAYEMASRSGVRIELDAAALPALPSALELAEAGVRTGGDRRNRDYSGPHVESTATDAQEALAFDPQTAGGLLVSLPADKARRARGHVRRARARRCTASVASRPARRAATVSGVKSAATASAVRTKARRRLRAARSRRGASSSSRLAVVIALWFVVTSGAFVRLTGVGPRLRQLAALRRQARSRRKATTRVIEFGNRLVALDRDRAVALATWLAARRVDGLSALGRSVALARAPRGDRADPARRRSRCCSASTRSR